MQLKYKLSIATAAILFSNSLFAEDYIRVNVMQYNEANSRVDVSAPSIEINKELGLDYTLNAKIISDSVSGATPIYSDTTSGASAYSRDNNSSNIKKQNVDFTEQRSFASFSVLKRLQNRDEITTSFSKSYESDYDSNTLNVDYLLWDNESKNRSYNFGLSYQANEILIKNCSLNSSCSKADTISGASSVEKSTMLSTELGVTQIIDKDSLAKLSIFYSNEDGYLSNPYYNVVRDSVKVVAELRPDKRVSYGFNLKYIKAINDNLSTKLRYKFYTDDWDISSHTLDINNYYELNAKYTLGFGIRYYTQSQAKFYNASTNYFTNEKYASHDDRLSSFNATTYKTSLEYKYNDKISYNIGFNYYDQSTGLKATYTSVGFKYKF